MFKPFKEKLQHHVATMLQHQQTLFVTDTDTALLWDAYLNSFPPGTNEIFRERREYDCSCCRHFIKSFGSVVVVKDNTLISIWDFDAGSTKYQPVINALAEYVKSMPIRDVFITKEAVFGTDHNCEMTPEGNVRTWDHFMVKLPRQFITASNNDTVGTIKGKLRDIRNVFQRSLEEISSESVGTVLDLIAQKSLYKGDEWQAILVKFLTFHTEYHDLPENLQEIYCWAKSVIVGGAVGKIKNHSIGTLLTDITQGVDLNSAVRKYEVIVAPTNYKRPKAIYTKRMVEQAQQTITELGYLDSLGRRHATVDDITVNNILFANKTTTKQMTGNDVFSDLKQSAVAKPKNFDKVEEVTIEHFIEHILPRTTNIELYLENRHAPNLMSVIAPKTPGSKSMLKWSNNFTWAYDKNLTDSMKAHVKAAGGKVDGVLRFSIQWNDEEYNPNDFDAHCVESNGNHIYFSNKGQIHPSTGILDVDIVTPVKGVVSVENITWSDINRMQEGEYEFYVHNYFHNGGRGGFKAEIEYDGCIHTYEYNKGIRHNDKVPVARLTFTRERGIQFIESLPSSTASKSLWNLTTAQFHPVSVCMFSPNYWDGQSGIGHKHYFFIINQCLTPDRPNGFFNEFLAEELLQHKHVFEALGGNMHVEPSDNQLSGLGFSSTKRNSVILRVEGHIARVLKIIF